MAIEIDDILNIPVSGANATSLPLPDEGNYLAMIELVEGKKVGSGDKERTVLNLVFTLLGDEFEDKPHQKPRKTVWLDLTEEGTIDMDKSKNTDLGRVRTALGQNEDGQDWSPSMMQAEQCSIVVEHDVYKGRTTPKVKFINTAESFEEE